MMRMRRRRIVGATVATAAVVGTAGAVRHHQDQKYANQDGAAQDQQDAAYQQGMADAQAQQPAAPPPPPAPAPQAAGSDLTSELQQMAQLHDAGVLTDEEFAQAKQKLLAG